MARTVSCNKMLATAVMIGSFASLSVLAMFLLSPRDGQADGRIRQFVVVPIERTQEVENLNNLEKQAVPEAQWQNAAGSLLPDDMVDPPSSKQVVLAAVSPPRVDPIVSPTANWQKNAVSVPALVQQSGRPKIAILIDDVGLSESRTHRLLRLQGPLTLAFLPYAEKLPSLTQEARRIGFELMVHMPMEAMDSAEDPGPGSLRLSQSESENMARFERNMAKFEGYVGINNHMGSRFTSDAKAMKPILQSLKERGLLFVDSVTSPNSVAGEIADQIGLPNAKRQIFLDNDQSLEAVRNSIAQLENVARRQGMAIAIGHPHPTTLAVLEQWLPMAAQRGFDLVPVSYVVQARVDQWRNQVAVAE